MGKAVYALDFAMYISAAHLLFPLKNFLEWYFTFMTSRKSADLGVNFFNELALFLNAILWYQIFFTKFG